MFARFDKAAAARRFPAGSPGLGRIIRHSYLHEGQVCLNDSDETLCHLACLPSFAFRRDRV